MITINSGKINIPDEDLFIGCAGDNLRITRQFVLQDEVHTDCTHRLYLTFDNDTTNYFVLDSEVVDGSTILNWIIKEEHIIKSGIVTAQIKTFCEDGSVIHTPHFYLCVLDSAEYTEDFEKENAEFLEYESMLNELKQALEEADLSSLVRTDRTIANLSLAEDISAEQLQSAMKTYPILIDSDPPLKSLKGENGQLYYDIEASTLYMCRGYANGYMWYLIGSAGEGKSAYEIAVDNGYEGTEEEWLESLKGADGSDGKDGVDGSDGKDGKDGYSCLDLCKGKKILFLGDSITASQSENGWYTHICDILAPSLAVNVAVNGAHWCDYEDTVYDGNPVFEGDDNNINNVIGNQVEKILRGKDSTNENYSQVADYDDFDIIFIACGTNDSEPTGDIESAFYNDSTVISPDETDRTTWAGAFYYAVDKLNTLYPNAKLFVCTPIQSAMETHTYSETKAKGDYLKLLCSRMSVNCIDTMQCGICGLYEVKGESGLDLKDGLHTNSNGALKMAKYNAMCVINYFMTETPENDDTNEGETSENLVLSSTDSDGNIYGDGNGYINNTYISANSPLSYGVASGYVSTGFMPVESGDSVYTDGTAVFNDTSCRLFVYDENKAYLGYLNAGSTTRLYTSTDSSGNLNGFSISGEYVNSSNETVTISSEIAYFRLSAKGTGDGFVVTVV